MDRTLSKYRLRLIINTSLLLISCIVLYSLYLVYADTFVRFDFITGWLLFLTILLMTFLNLRKKTPFLPLGSTSFWMQVHIYVGFFSLLIFLVHLEGRLPENTIGQILSGIFLILFFGGILGLTITRLFPKRMALQGEEVIYERIPFIRESIKSRIKSLIVRSIMETESTSVSAFYKQKLEEYMNKPKDFWQHVLSSRNPYREIVDEMRGFERYLNDKEKEIFREIMGLVLTKTDLDYHYASQTLLRYWLFFHVPFSYAAILIAISHLVLVYAFTGGM